MSTSLTGQPSSVTAPQSTAAKASQQSVVARAPRSGAEPLYAVENRRRTIRYAVTSNARTVRLCMIMLIASVPADFTARPSGLSDLTSQYHDLRDDRRDSQPHGRRCMAAARRL